MGKQKRDHIYTNHKQKLVKVLADTIQLYLKMTRLEKLYEKEKYQICENLKEDKHVKIKSGKFFLGAEVPQH